METTLHRQFKTLYSAPGDQQEKEVGAYRIDVAKYDRLVEIQHSSLSAIRDKVATLLKKYRVLVVKPLVIKKRIVRLSRKGGQVISRRWSPKQGQVWDLFDELIYFRQLFPHANLTLDVPLVQIEEWRYQGHGRRWRIRQQDYQVQDQLLLSVEQTLQFQGPLDLWQIIPQLPKSTFTTQELAEHLSIPRFRAQKIAYTLQHCQAVRRVGKLGNSFIYSPERSRARTKRNVG